jgi:hypothetical protein
MSWISSVFTGKSKLLKELEKVKSDLEECSNKLLEKQEHINQTNAYWKKKMHETKSKKPVKKEL